ncbi:hypothetical protein IFM89_010146 [Coptis chinensis]|uniref:Saccharopine dehydrogenase NADP binding domain-containing protein n=1 Tax=Coptis chinensis TaxID=261450 RepID=A0A835M4J4_9MAGN|nr:hypothetical protein IFM89_010146 [Coptis chinensis]
MADIHGFAGMEGGPIFSDRGPSKLVQTLTWARSSSQSTTPSSISIVKADISDPSSLLNLFTKSKLVLNCVGPFRLYGEPIVSACVETGYDYLDICGEPDFMEKREVRYHEKKVEAYFSLESEKSIVGNFGMYESIVFGCCQDGEVDGIEEVETQ